MLKDGHITQEQLEMLLLSQRELLGLKGVTHDEYEKSLVQPAGGESEEASKQRVRVGFLSSFLWTHSVGKLMKGVVQQLDKNQFYSIIFRTSHFFEPSTFNEDKVAAVFNQAADEVVVLKKQTALAAQSIADAKLDVLVYPELGMDAWTYFLAFRRLAPVQLVFWGHPVTTAFPRDTIDYFVTSSLFEPRLSHESGGQLVTGGNFGKCGDWKHPASSVATGCRYSEQTVLLDGLTTLYSKPKLTQGFMKSKQQLGFHSDAHLYSIPQSIMKFHPDFDEVLLGILSRDPLAEFVITFKEAQIVWKETLVNRLTQAVQARNLPNGRFHFTGHLDQSDFLSLIASSDVVLDPFPWGGGVTTLDAFVSSTPVVTAPKLQTVVALAAGMYGRMGHVGPHTKCVVDSIEQFANTAVQIATNQTLRQEISSFIAGAQEDIYEDDRTVGEWQKFLYGVGRQSQS